MDKTPPSPLVIRLQQLVKAKSYQKEMLGMGGSPPETGRARIEIADQELATELTRLLKIHAPENTDIEIRQSGGYVEGPVEAFEKIWETFKSPGSSLSY